MEIVSIGIERLWDRLSQEYEQFQGAEDQVTELKSKLNSLKSFLKDADVKKHTSDRVRNCLEEIKEIVYDAEDIIETFILKEKLRKKSGIIRHIGRFPSTIVNRRELVSNIEGISKRISNVNQDMQNFGVQQFMIADGSQSSYPLQHRHMERRQEFARDSESNLVGLEENVKKLVGYLVEKDDIRIVSVTGMGGLGKTTLARQAFNHEMVKNKFDRFVWVCVSQDFTRKSVWQTILRSLTSKERKEEILKMEEDELHGELFQLLGTSKSLIVLDDIWKEEDWDRIKPIFPPNKGDLIKRKIKTTHTYYALCLVVMKRVNILQAGIVKLTSRNESAAMRRDTTYINFKPECLTIPDSWTLFQRIAMPREDASDEKMEEMGKEMVKHCGGLPLAIKVLGGMLAEKYTLHYWKQVAENIGSHLVGGSTDFNDDDKSSPVNYVLSLSFEELPSYLKHCFLYLAHFPEDHKIKVKDLSYYWAAEGIFEPRHYDGKTIRDVGDSYIEELVRRNMVISGRDVTTLRYETCHLHDMMRDVCLFKAKEENFLQIASTHPSTAKLIHLRYLSLKRVEVSHIPASLGNLMLLIYLNLGIANGDILVPNVLIGMQELRYLALPWQMDKKTKLELSNLVILETLKNFSTKNSSVKDLRGMVSLRTLGINLIDETSMEIVSAAIGGMRHLEDLYIEDRRSKRNVEEGTVWDFSHVKHLSLIIHMPRPNLLKEQHFPSHLTTLSLEDCCLEEDPMPILEKLLQLKEVTLNNKSFIGKRMVCSRGGFPQLQKLKLSYLMEWEEWIVEEGSMPLLHTLDFYYCPKLKELPDGLRFITSLKELGIFGATLEFKEKLSRGGEDFYKVQHIPLVQFNYTSS